jgi:hypothetical protein
MDRCAIEAVSIGKFLNGVRRRKTCDGREAENHQPDQREPSKIILPAAEIHIPTKSQESSRPAQQALPIA